MVLVAVYDDDDEFDDDTHEFFIGVRAVRDAELCGGARRGRLARDEVRRVSRLERSGAVVEAKFVGEFYQISVDYGQFARVRERADQSGQEENI